MSRREAHIPFVSNAAASLVVCLVVVASAAPAAAAADARRLAVLPITGDGVLVDDLRPIEDALRDQVTKLGRYRVVDRARTLGELRSARSLGLDCGPFEVSCLVRLGLVGEMELLVVPAATREGRFVAVTLSLVDVALEREVSRVARVVDPRAMSESVARLVADLLNEDPNVGMLAITATPDGATVTIDGEERGRTPLRAPIGGLSAGKHELVLAKEGHRSARAVVVVKARSISRYDLRLAALDGDDNDEPASEALVELVPDDAAPLSSGEEELVVAGDTAPLVGAATSGAIGAATALGGGLGALALFGLEQQDTLPLEQREGARLAAQALLVVAAAGALVAIGSAAFIGVELARVEAPSK